MKPRTKDSKKYMKLSPYIKDRQTIAVTDIHVEVRDYLVPLSDVERSRRYRRKQHPLKVGCSHHRLRQFEFSDGKTIKMCPDCDTYDARRHRALCKGEPLKDCTVTTKKVVGRTPEKKWDARPATQGMVHIVTRNHDDVMMTETYNDFTHRIKSLTYKKKEEGEHKQQPQTSQPLPVIREEAQRKVTPSQPIIKVDVEWVVVPLPCTEIVKDIPDWTAFYVAMRRWWSFWCVYNEPEHHTPEYTAPHQRSMMEFGDTTLGKTRGKLHTIGGRWCKCSECREQRRTRYEL